MTRKTRESAPAPVLVRRGYVCDYEAGERPLPAGDPVLRYGRPGLLPLSTVACVATTERVVSLTYDDGPDPRFTAPVLDALAAHGQRATFFVMVRPAEIHRGLIRRIIAEGHEVALHGIDHTRLSELPLRTAAALIREGKERLEQVTGRRTRLFRPTYGSQTLQQLVATRALGLDVVVWSAWARDWEPETAEVIAGRAAASLHYGGFVLLHDASGDGVGADGPLDRGRATELLMKQLDERGYSSRTVSELLAQYPAVRTVWT
jgi:peptidoglycan/xylan/chitin deacetylase (PgdA/CDA1 family)